MDRVCYRSRKILFMFFLKLPFVFLFIIGVHSRFDSLSADMMVLLLAAGTAGFLKY